MFIQNYSEVSQKSKFFQNTEKKFFFINLYEQHIGGWGGERDWIRHYCLYFTDLVKQQTLCETLLGALASTKNKTWSGPWVVCNLVKEKDKYINNRSTRQYCCNNGMKCGGRPETVLESRNYMIPQGSRHPSSSWTWNSLCYAVRCFCLFYFCRNSPVS